MFSTNPREQDSEQDDRTIAIAVYGMASNLIAARIAAGGIKEPDNTHLVASLVREQAKALVSGTLLGTISSYFDPENYE